MNQYYTRKYEDDKLSRVFNNQTLHMYKIDTNGRD